MTENAPHRVHVVPHTHWDREWYSSFPTFRLRLVDLLDEFLPFLESDPSYAHFLLDGQMAVVDDYLEVRPGAEPLLRRLATAGRLAMGPWYVLMDEFLVSGETIIRNLQMGVERAAHFGGAARVGYLPDMFGHVAQMPQLLGLAGLEHAVVWRGVPSSVDRTGFWWSSPDGSTVRAEYMPVGYGNGAAVGPDPGDLVERVRSHHRELGPLLPDGFPMLWMNGTDHQVPQRWLGRVVAEADASTEDYAIVICSLAEHLALAPTDGLPEVRGELRSGARANLLMGVASNRVDVKQAAARAELALERLAEPLCALHLPADRWPQALLDVAWKEVVRNSAHDSVCACSIDEVCDAVLHRYAEALDTAVGLANRAVKAVAAAVPEEGWVVVNADPRTRSGMVELVVEAEEAPRGTQLVEKLGGFDLDVTVKGRDLGTYLGMLRSQHLSDGVYLNGIDIDENDVGVDITLRIDSRMVDSFNVEEARRTLYALGGARPDDDFRARGSQPTALRLVARARDVPGYGWATWQPEPLDCPEVSAATTADTVVLTNGAVTVAVDPMSGLVSLDGDDAHAAGGLLRLVDEGDLGDTYNYSPPAADDLIDTPREVSVEVEAAGPVMGRVRIRRTYTWPERCAPAEGGRREGSVDHVVDTLIELGAGERFVRCSVTLDNRSRDHRLRLHLPLPHVAGHSEAECAFAIVRRGLEAEGGPTERALPTYPSRRFVRAGGLTVAHEGLLEYELVGEGTELAVTLLRATGMLSRAEMAYRPLPAGPDVAMEGPQVQGRHTLRFAFSADPDIDPYRMTADAFLFLSACRSPGGGAGEPSGSALDVSGAEVSAVRRRHGRLEVRVFNPAPRPTTVKVDGRRGWVVDLLDRAVAPFEGSLPLEPWQIATLHLVD